MCVLNPTKYAMYHKIFRESINKSNSCSSLYSSDSELLHPSYSIFNFAISSDTDVHGQTGESG